MSEISIDDFLKSIPDVEGLDKNKLKEQYNSIEEPEEQLKFMQKLYKQAEARYEDLKARQVKEERAARTRRLIKLGGLVESVLGSDIDENEFRELLYDVKNLKTSNDSIYIQIGAAMERILDRELISQDVQRFINFIQYQEKGNYFSNAMNRGYTSNNEQ